MTASVLNAPSYPQTTWTTTNIAEAVPGIPSPLGWSIWARAGELAMRSAFHAIGALSKGEVIQPNQPEERLLGISLGHPALNVDLICAWAERIPATDPVTMSEQMFSAAPAGYASRRQYRYYPRVLAKAGTPFITAPRLVRADRPKAEQLRARALPILAAADERIARRVLEEAIGLHLQALSHQTLITLGACQPITDLLLRTAARVGVAGQELMAGYGGHDETLAVADVWECSRGRLTLDELIARHGFHGWREGELSNHSWRENPAPLQQLVDSFRARSDDQDPLTAERDRIANRHRLERDFLARLPAHRRHAGRALIRAAAYYVPIRGIAKGNFMQVFDVIRAAARRLGHHLTEQSLLDDPDDIFYLTVDELRSSPLDRRDDIAARRKERDRYQAHDVPTLWQGAAEPLISTTALDSMLTGTAASPGQVTGRARVVIEPGDADVDEGEILVARDTDPSWASLMFLSAGLIADIGGVMSHTAIVARELSIPCVVNTKNATMTVCTGDLIRIDGAAGTIEILERANSADVTR